jgi:malate dehydrogenase (oxaloacetate-decarboxylating)
LAALINSLKLLNKKIDSTKVVITGSGSAGYGIFKILEKAGCKDIIVNDSKGAIYKGRKDLEHFGQNKGKRVIQTTHERLRISSILFCILRNMNRIISRRISRSYL